MGGDELVAVITAGGNPGFVRLFNGGRNAEVSVDIPIGTARSTLRHADGDVYTAHDAQSLADLLEQHWAHTAPDDGTRTRAHARTVCGFDLLATVEHGPPLWRYPRVLCRREVGGWWHVGIGWRYTCLSVGVRRARTSG